MAVFIAGAKNPNFKALKGSSNHQARAMHVRRLSDIPAAIFARVLADIGAMRKTSAQFLSY